MKKIIKFICISAAALPVLSANAAEIGCDDTSITCAQLGYNYSSSSLTSFDSSYDCTACPLDGSIWSCVSKGSGSSSGGGSSGGSTSTPSERCPDGFSTDISPTCEWILGSEYTYACDDPFFLRLYYEDAASDCTRDWGNKEIKNTYKYNCKKGTANGKTCYSYLFLRYAFEDATSTPEPCSVLYGAEPSYDCSIQ